MKLFKKAALTYLFTTIVAGLCILAVCEFGWLYGIIIYFAAIIITLFILFLFYKT